ncbi:hypothetical protein CCAX7_14450 [Capsulimonas corticalis]|uniref:Uncharacterized protein n=1 Tax=Capsulimonas corticalis TaxID=2219043 RepID=A0A402CZH2_9BACT|nr:hypothetical protein [Capsulimonas corticalis]BDI29394.1 hypothetical protein CCAX7_14450 [Capsulimonas corticalis]
MTLITTGALTTQSDAVGKIYSMFAPAIDVANALAKVHALSVYASFATDPVQGAAWFQGARTVYESASATASASGATFGNAFGGGGLGGGSFGLGSGLLNRQSIIAGNWYGEMETWRTQIRTTAAQDGITTVNDVISYALYRNTAAAFSCLFTPDFASLYSYAYNLGRQLDPGSVFAPSGIVMASFSVTGAGAGTRTAGVFPTANGYAVPAPTITGAGCNPRGVWSSATAYATLDSVMYSGSHYVAVAGSTNVTPGTDPAHWVINTFGNPSYVGGMPVAQGFAATLAPQIKVTTNITGAGAVTVTALNQAGNPSTWTATLTGLTTASAAVTLTPTNAGDRMAAVPSAIAIPAGITAGAFQIITQAERTP